MRSLSSRLAAGGLAAGGLALAVMAVLAGPFAGAALAHERRTVGPLQFVVGWADEPAYAGFLNAVQLRISDTSAGGEPVPVTDVGDALKLEVSFGTDTVGPLDLRSVFNSPGEYQSAMIPSRPGTYAFRFVGTVKGQPIDQTFTSSDTTFDSPAEAAAIEFPVKDPTRADLGNLVERLDPRVAEAIDTAGDARGSAGLATILGAGGLLVGLTGIGLAVTAKRGAKA